MCCYIDHITYRIVERQFMKIAFVYTGFGEGGISSALAALLKEIAKDKKLDITLYLFGKDNESRFVTPDNVKVVFPSEILALWFKDKKKCSHKDILLWYIEHFIGIKISRRPIEWLALRKKQKKKYDIAIAYVNDINEPAYINMFANDFVLKCLIANHKIAWSHNDPYRLGYTNKYILDRYEKFDTIVNVSNACKVKFDKIAPEFIEKSEVVHNCIYEIDADLSGIEKQNKDGKFHIVSVCRIDNKQKRIDRAIDTCIYLKQKGYGNRFVWHQYGSGSDEAALKVYAQEKCADDIFLFEGTTNKPLERMAESDVFIMTSDYEACSLTLLESIKAMTPVIVTDFPEAWESIEHGKNGYIVPKTPEAIGDEIIRMLEMPERLENCRIYMKSHPLTNERALREFYKVIYKEG